MVAVVTGDNLDSLAQISPLVDGEVDCAVDAVNNEDEVWDLSASLSLSKQIPLGLVRRRLQYHSMRLSELIPRRSKGSMGGI
jgi:hypothetical protein